MTPKTRGIVLGALTLAFVVGGVTVSKTALTHAQDTATTVGTPQTTAINPAETAREPAIEENDASDKNGGEVTDATVQNEMNDAAEAKLTPAQKQAHDEQEQQAKKTGSN